MFDSGGIRTHATEVTGALMGHAFSVSAWVVDLMNDICRHKQLKNSMGS